jgi:hypothetical protein
MPLPGNGQGRQGNAMIDLSMAEKIQPGDVLEDKHGNKFIVNGIANTPGAPKGTRWKYALTMEDGQQTYINELHFDRMSLVKEAAPVYPALEHHAPKETPKPKGKKAK